MTLSSGSGVLDLSMRPSGDTRSTTMGADGNSDDQWTSARRMLTRGGEGIVYSSEDDTVDAVQARGND